MIPRCAMLALIVVVGVAGSGGCAGSPRMRQGLWAAVPAVGAGTGLWLLGGLLEGQRDVAGGAPANTGNTVDETGTLALVLGGAGVVGGGVAGYLIVPDRSAAHAWMVETEIVAGAGGTMLGLLIAGRHVILPKPVWDGYAAKRDVLFGAAAGLIGGAIAAVAGAPSAKPGSTQLGLAPAIGGLSIAGRF